MSPNQHISSHQFEKSLDAYDLDNESVSQLSFQGLSIKKFSMEVESESDTDADTNAEANMVENEARNNHNNNINNNPKTQAHNMTPKKRNSLDMDIDNLENNFDDETDENNTNQNTKSPIHKKPKQLQIPSDNGYDRDGDDSNNSEYSLNQIHSSSFEEESGRKHENDTGFNLVSPSAAGFQFTSASGFDVFDTNININTNSDINPSIKSVDRNKNKTNDPSNDDDLSNKHLNARQLFANDIQSANSFADALLDPNQLSLALQSTTTNTTKITKSEAKNGDVAVKSMQTSEVSPDHAQLRRQQSQQTKQAAQTQAQAQLAQQRQKNTIMKGMTPPKMVNKSRNPTIAMSDTAEASNREIESFDTPESLEGVQKLFNKTDKLYEALSMMLTQKVSISIRKV